MGVEVGGGGSRGQGVGVEGKDCRHKSMTLATDIAEVPTDGAWYAGDAALLPVEVVEVAVVVVVVEEVSAGGRVASSP